MIFVVLTRYSILWIRNHHSSSANFCEGVRCEHPRIVFGTLDVCFRICKYIPVSSAEISKLTKAVLGCWAVIF